MSDSGRRSAIARALRHDKSLPTDKYKRVTPQHQNNILKWVVSNKPEYALIDRNPPEILRRELIKRGLSIQLYKRILLNETIVTVDELYNISEVLKCKAKDLL
ncbi:MAG: hypothetical protein HOP11_03465 [Saprospiraceae bacterium]|nr:hypothetical protein [Saprospiraceae bacterium]